MSGTLLPPIRLMIVGAAKSGTTSLKAYLGQHPGICTHWQREMRYFASEEGYGAGYEAIFPTYFDEAAARDRVLLAKSVAVLYTPEAMDRLRAHNPRAEIVLLLRHPVDRAYSEFWYARRRGWESAASFEESLARNQVGEVDPRCQYLLRSRYVEHLEQLLERFPRGQVHVHLLAELKEDAVALCQRLYGLFDELDPTFVPEVGRRTNRAAMPRSSSLLRLLGAPQLGPVKRLLRRLLSAEAMERSRERLQRLSEEPFEPPPIEAATRQSLLTYFHPYNERLGQLLELDLSVWDDLPMHVDERVAVP